MSNDVTDDKDIVEEAREMLRKTTPRPWVVVDKNEYDPKRARKLLGVLADEVERLRKLVGHMNLPLGE